MGFYQDVYRPPTPEQLRNERAERNRRMFATPRPLPYVSSAEAPVSRGAKSRGNGGMRHDVMEDRRARGLARYDELRATGLKPSECKKQVATEIGLVTKTVTKWVYRRDGGKDGE